MEKTLTRIPIGEIDNNNTHLVKSKRSLFDFIGDVWQPDTLDWTVLYEDRIELDEPTYSRTITVRPVDDIMDITKYASNNIQTIGLSLFGEKRLKFANAVTSKGVERCPDIGLMTHFENPWDGQFVINKMIRWSTLGGP